MVGTRTRKWGELEREILHILWNADAPLGAGAVQEAFTGKQPAYTTILTSLDRLQAKGLVTRIEESPRKVRFAAASTAAEHASASMHDVLDTQEDRRAALLKFAGNLHDDDADALLDALMSRDARPQRKKK